MSRAPVDGGRTSHSRQRENSRKRSDCHFGFHPIEPLEQRILLSSQDPLSEEIRLGLADGLEQFSLWTDSLGSLEAVTSRIPLAGGPSLGSLAHFGDVVNQYFVQKISAVLRAVDPLSLDGLMASLQGLAGSFTAVFDGVQVPLNISVNPAGILGNLTDTEINFSLPLEATLPSLGSLNLGAVLAQYQMGLPSDINLDVLANLSMDMTFGLSLTAGVPSPDGFFVRPGDFDLGAAFGSLNPLLADIDMPLGLGFLDADIVDGALQMLANVDFDFHNPDADPLGNFSLDELFNTPLDQLLSSLSTGDLSGLLPVQAILGSANFGVPRINLNCPDIFNQPVNVSFNADLENLLPFGRIDADMVMEALDQLSATLSTLQTAEVFTRVQALGTQKLSDLMEFGQALRDTIQSALMKPVQGAYELYETAFGSAQELLQQLADAPGVVLASAADFADGVLTYTIRFADSSISSEGFAYDYSAGPLSVSAQGSVTRDLAAEVALTLGLDLSAMFAEVTGTQTPPGNGQLSQNASFDLQIGQDAPVHVVVPKDATDGNAGLDDLAADINDALAAAGLKTPGLAGVALVQAFVVNVGTVENPQQRIALRTAGPWVPARLTLTPGSGAGQLGFSAAQEDHSQPGDFAFIENASASAGVLLSATMPAGGQGLGGQGRLGLLGSIKLYDAIAYLAGAGSTVENPIRANVSFNLGQADTRYGLGDLAAAIRDNSEQLVGDSLSFDAQAICQFRVVLESEIVELLDLDPNQQWFANIAFPDVMAGQLPTVTGLDELLGLACKISPDDFIAALKATVNYLTDLGTLSGPLSWQLPGTNLQLGSLLDYARQFSDFVTQFEIEGPSALDIGLPAVAARIRGLLGLAADQFTIELDPGSPGVPEALKMRFAFESSFDREAALNLDLAKLMAASLWPDMADYTQIVDLGASGTVQADGSAGVVLDLGINLQDARPFLYDDTGIDGTLRVQARNLSFDLTLGPLIGMSVVGGHLLVGDCPGTGPAAFGAGEIPAAHFALSLADEDPNTLARYYLSDLASSNYSDVTATMDAQVDLRLPFAGPWVAPADPDLWMLAGVTGQGELADFDGGFPTFVTPDVLNIEALKDGLRVLLNRLREALGEQSFSLNLPIVGTQLNTAYLDTLIGRLDLWTDYEPATALDWATDNLSAMFGLSAQIDAAQTPDPEAGDAAIEFRVRLADTYTFAAGAVDFTTGLPGLGLDVEAHASADLHWAFNLGFGVRKDKGFYIIANNDGFDTALRFADNSPTLGVTLSAAVTDLDADGTLGFLKIKADKIDGKPIAATGFFNIALDEFMGGRVYFNSLSASTYAVDVSYGISADINAALEVYYSANFPSITSNLNMHWAFDNDPVTAEESPLVKLEDISVDLGEYLGDVAEPVLTQINNILAPIRPILEVLTVPLPGISRVAGHDITLLDLIESFANGDPDTQYIADLARIVEIVADMPTFSSHSINLGTYTFGQGLERAELPEDVVLQSDLFEIAGNPVAAAHAAGGDFNGFLSDLEELGIELPILNDPFSLIQLFLGRDVDLVQYTTPELSLGIDYRKNTPIIFPWLQFTISMEASISAKAVFGYDTRGLREFADGGPVGDLPDGFYVRTGSNYPLIRFDGHAAVGLGVGIGGGAGVEGGVGLTGHVYAADTDGDGRLHLDEFADYLPDNIFDAFDADGSIYVDLRLWWDTPFFDGHYTLAKATLMDFSTGTAEGPQNIEIEFNQRAAQNAADVGMAPNAHVMPVPWASRGVQWYKFQTDRDNEVLDFQAVDLGGNDDLVMAIFDSDGNRLVNSPGAHGSAGLNDVTLPTKGTYFIALTEPTDDLPPESLSITPNSNPADGTVVYYVNDQDDTPPEAPGSFYYEANPFTSAVGNDANSGLDPAHPKASIAAVTSSLTGNEGRVYILVDSGHYYITDPAQRAVVQQDNVWFVGTHYSDVCYTTGPAIDASNAGNLRLYGLNFDGNSQATAIRLLADGIPQAGTSNLAPEYAATIEQNDFRDCGVGIDAQGFQSVAISGNRFLGDGTSGIDLGTSAIGIISDNDFTWYDGQYGIRSAARFSAYVAGNVLKGSRAAVMVLDGGSIALTGNTITGDVIVRGDRDNSIENNTITGNLEVRSPENADWKILPWPGQWINQTYLDPVRSHEEFSQGILGNTISGVVRIQHAVSTVIEGNISLGGVVVEGDNNLVTPVAIRANSAINAGAGTAIEVTKHSWADITDNGMIAGSVGVKIDSSQMSLIGGNVIEGSQYGIHVGAAGSMSALGNKIRNGVGGILIENNWYVNIQDNRIEGSEFSIHGIGNWAAPRVVGNVLDGLVNFEGGPEIVPAPFREQGRFLQNVVKGNVTLHTGHRLDVSDNVLSTGSLTVWTLDRGRVTSNGVFAHLDITTGGNATVSDNTLLHGNLGLTVASGYDWQLLTNTLEAQGGDITVTGGRRADVQGNTVANGDLRITITDEPTNGLAPSLITGNSVSGELQLTGGPGADINNNPLLGNLNVQIAGDWRQSERAFHTEVRDNPDITGMSGHDLEVGVPGELNFRNNTIGSCHVRLGSVGATSFSGNTVNSGDVFLTVGGSADDWDDDPTVVTDNTLQTGKMWITGGPGLDVYENVRIDRGIEVTTATSWLPHGRLWHTSVQDNDDIGGIILDLPGSAYVSGNTITNWGGIEISGTSLAPHNVLNNTVDFEDITVSSRSTANIVGNTVASGSIIVNVVDGALPRTSHVVSDNRISGSIDINGGPCATIDENTLESGSIYIDIANDQIIFRYCTPEGATDHEFPVNPNGSTYNIAGICNREGNVFALMPHPERASWVHQIPYELGGRWAQAKDGAWGNQEKMHAAGPGRMVFESLREALGN